MYTQRTIVILFILFLVAGAGGLFLFMRNSEAPVVALEATPMPEEATALTATLQSQALRSDAVVVDARVVPIRSAELTFGITGVPVTEILVQEGETVAQNTSLLRLDTRELQLRVDQAQSALDRARAEYQRLVEGATPAQIAQARAQVAQAQARLRQVRGNVTAEDLAAARARLEEARTRLAELEAGPKPAEIEVTRATLDRAQLNLVQQRDELSAAKTVARSRIERAANELRDAQDAYSQIYWELRDAEDRLDGLELQEARNREAAALRAVENAEQELEQARVLYEEAQQVEQTGLRAAEAQVRDAQARLDLLLAGADPDEMAEARARVADAVAALTRLRGDARAGSVAAAEADVANAQASLDDLLAGPLESELARAEAGITELEAELQRQELALERATLSSPIPGVVAEINVDIGEVPASNASAAVIADISEWQLETEDLNELSIVRIREGDQAIVTFFALPDLELRGTVRQIKPLGKSDRGETIYTVTIALDEQDARLRWNMVAQVTITPQN